MRLLPLLVGVAALVLSPSQTRGSNQDLHIQEVMAGANGNSAIQFLVIELAAAGENLWGPQGGEAQSRALLVFFDKSGREIGKFTFPTNPPSGNSRRVLVATREFADLPGAPAPDILIPPLLNAPSGKVCFRNNTGNAAADPKNECLSYGGYTGDTESNRGGEFPGIESGPPAPLLSIMNTVSLRRTGNSGRNSDFSLTATPRPVNSAGESFTIPVAAQALQGEALFHLETFSGNGRTCSTCHVARESYGLTPENIQSRFATLSAPTPSFDPLFIGETAPSPFDSGFDFNLNTLELTAEVSTPAPCTGELRGLLTTGNRGRAKVLARTGPTTYLIYGGANPRLSGVVSDGRCSATVSRVVDGDLAARAGAFSGLEDAHYMREPDRSFSKGRGLILENIDGFNSPPVFRRSPHLLNLSQTAPYGLSGEFADLRDFAVSAVKQHFPRTLSRNSDGPNPDFRLPAPEELDALEAFMLTLEFPAGNDPNKWDLVRFATTELQKKGREEFVTLGCAACHGGPVLSQTTLPIRSHPVGSNAGFNTGTSAGSFGESLPCEPAEKTSGPCGSREFSTPQLFNLPNLGPFFHNSSAVSLSDAVDFYLSSEFGNSPANLEFINTGIGVVPTGAITEFLAGLVERPYTLTESPVRFGARPARSGRTAARTVTLRNSGVAPLEFDSDACRLQGANPEDFAIVECPLNGALASGDSRTLLVAFEPTADGLKSAILEIRPLGTVPSGIDLFGVGGALGPAPRILEVRPNSGTTMGGDTVTLVGTDFSPGSTVIIGGVRAGFVEVLNPTTIEARTGAHAAGAADVEVIPPDGQTAVLGRGYEYLASSRQETR